MRWTAFALANLPALAIGWHLPAQTSPDYAAMVLLNTILQGDESSRLFQRLVKEKEISLDWTAGVNVGLGNEFDYNGPMLLTARTTYKPGHTVDEILKEVDAVVADVQAKGVTAKELADAKVRRKGRSRRAWTKQQRQQQQRSSARADALVPRR